MLHLLQVLAQELILQFSSNNNSFGVIVDFEDGTEEDMISDRESLTLLRPRSAPLQGGECFDIKEGDNVLVMDKTRSRILFFDALVVKPFLANHSKRVYCRCTFEIKWLNPDISEETKIVSSSSIMKHVNKPIESHPEVKSFLNALNSRNDSVSSLFEETNFSDDLHDLLDRQIEEISKLADGSSDFVKDSLLEVKGVCFSGAMEKAITSPESMTSSKRNTKKQTSERKVETESESKKEMEEKPFLSPLAARAALALLVHEANLATELSISQDPEKLRKEHCEMHTDFPSQHIQLKSQVSAKSKDSVSITKPAQNQEDGLSEESLHALTVSSETDGHNKSREVKHPRFSSRKDAKRKSSLKSEDSQIGILSSNTAPYRKGNGQIARRRLTRSTFHGENEVNETDQQSSNKSINNSVPKRLTCSAKEREESSGNFKQELETCDISVVTNDMSLDDYVTPEKILKSVKKPVVSSADSHMNSAPERKISASIVTVCTEENHGEVQEDKETQRRKKKPADLLVLRSSPRLGTLPRTRRNV